MPLYNIKEKGDMPFWDKSHHRVVWSRLIGRCNEFLTKNGVSPRIYTDFRSFEIISESTSFSFSNIVGSELPMYRGHFMGWSVFVTDELDDYEYVLGLNEHEMRICKRKDKLKHIINRLNVTL